MSGLSDPEQCLKSLGYTLPEVTRPLGAYRTVRRWENLIISAGVLPLKGAELARVGRVGVECTLKEAQEAAILSLLNILSIFKEELGSLARITGILRLEGYIAAAPDFYDHPLVLNPASELLVNLFGEEGEHTRIAIGVANLPRNAPVELCLWAVTKPS